MSNEAQGAPTLPQPLPGREGSAAATFGSHAVTGKLGAAFSEVAHAEHGD